MYWFWQFCMQFSVLDDFSTVLQFLIGPNVSLEKKSKSPPFWKWATKFEKVNVQRNKTAVFWGNKNLKTWRWVSV